MHRYSLSVHIDSKMRGWFVNLRGWQKHDKENDAETQPFKHYFAILSLFHLLTQQATELPNRQKPTNHHQLKPTAPPVRAHLNPFRYTLLPLVFNILVFSTFPHYRGPTEYIDSYEFVITAKFETPREHLEFLSVLKLFTIRYSLTKYIPTKSSTCKLQASVHTEVFSHRCRLNYQWFSSARNQSSSLSVIIDVGNTWI